MPKDIPDCPKRPNLSPAVESRSYHVELITPMVGGGVAPGEVDPHVPIRPTAIRGHLRHWWRLIRGYSLGAGMWQREEEIFGSIEFPSPLQLRVQSPPVTNWVEPGNIRNPNLKYLLFPSIEDNQRLAQDGLAFQLHLEWPDATGLTKRRAAQNQTRKREKKPQLSDQIARLDSNIEQAVRAWLTFGGVGARTRRGCGALFANDTGSAPRVDDVQNWLKQFLDPASNIEKIFLRPLTSPLEAWKNVADTWKKFRQPGPAQRGEQRRRFPEAETIRRATGSRSRRGRVFSEGEMPNGFPRAELGLPIIFQFKDPADPDPTTVNQSGSDAAGRPFQRMASPFILKPLAVAKDRALPMIVLLKTPRVSSVRVAPTPQGELIYPVLGSPIVDSLAGSGIEAFLKFADAAGFTEVSV